MVDTSRSSEASEERQVFALPTRREGGIPAHKYGRVWRFDQEELDRWMKQARSASEDNGPDRPESE